MTEDKMRKAWTFALFLLIPLLSLAQQGPNRFPPINIYHGNPNGQACTTSMAIVQSDANGKSYTCFGGVWGPGSEGGGVPGGSNLQLQFNNAGAFGGATGISTDSATKSILNVNSTITSGVPMLDIRHPNFAGGAKCDGTTDDTPALQAAINSLPARGGNIQIPSTTTQPCYFAGSSSISWGSHTQINLYFFGTTRFGTSFTIPHPTLVNIYGMGAGSGAQFQGAGTTANVYVQPDSGGASGTLGSAVSVTTGSISNGSTSLTVADPTGYSIGDTISMAAAGAGAQQKIVTITNIAGNVFTVSAAAQNTMTDNMIGHQLTFTPSTMSALAVGAGINVTGLLTCNISTISRASNKVTATLSGSCHIPPGAGVTVAGVTDSSFNGASSGGTQFQPQVSDYVTNVMTWNQTGADASSSGGTVTGIDEDSVDHVEITAVTPTTATAMFWRSHAATDLWGIVTLYNASFATNTIQNIGVTNYVGTAILTHAFHGTMVNVGTTSGTSSPISFGIEYEASFMKMTGVAVTANNAWGIRMSNPYNNPNGIGGPLYIDNSFVMRGIKMDHGAPQIFADNVIFDQPTSGDVRFDPTTYWSSGQATFSIRNSGKNDNPNGYDTCYLYYTQPVYTGLAVGKIQEISGNDLPGCITNDYAPKQIQNQVQGYYGLNEQGGVPGTYRDGKVTITELRGSQASMQPAVIPLASLPVVTNPASWPQTTCTVTPIVFPIDGTTSAGSLTGNGSSQVLTYNFTPAVGDKFIIGVWANTPTLKKTAVGQNGPIIIDNLGSTHWGYEGGTAGGQNVGIAQYDAAIYNDTWHPVVGIVTVSFADGTAGTLRMYLPCLTDRTLQFWQPFAFYIPASANVPSKTVEQWRKEMLHGYVPSGGQPSILYAHYPVDVETNSIAGELPNNTASGTTLNKLAVVANVGGVAKVQTAPTSSLHWTGIVIGGATGSTAGNTILARFGQASCIFDGATTIGDYVIPSTTVAGDCQDSGSTYPTGGAAVVGKVLSVNSGAGTTAMVNLYSPGVNAAAVPIASVGTNGVVQPDGTSITITAPGVISATGATVPIVADFTSSTTTAPAGWSCTVSGTGPFVWTCTAFPTTGTRLCKVLAIGGGGGGGSGGTVASGSTVFGGGGGAGGAWNESETFPCSDFGGGTTASVTVSIGKGGDGGAAQAGTSATGNNGSIGGSSFIAGASGYRTFQSNTTTTSSNGGTGGSGASGNGGNAQTQGSRYTQCAGANGGSGVGSTQACSGIGTGAAGGSGGGGLTAGPTAAAGGPQGLSSAAIRIGIATTVYTGASLTGGTVGGGAGQTPTFASISTAIGQVPGAIGGTGGGSNTGGNGGAGGDGMTCGGGGGGGGAAINGSSSGKGGKGGDGCIRVTVQ